VILFRSSMYAKIMKLLSRLQKEAFMYGSFGDGPLIDILSLEIPLTDKLGRENDAVGIKL